MSGETAVILYLSGETAVVPYLSGETAVVAYLSGETAVLPYLSGETVGVQVSGRPAAVVAEAAERVSAELQVPESAQLLQRPQHTVAHQQVEAEVQVLQGDHLLQAWGKESHTVSPGRRDTDRTALAAGHIH